MRPAPRLPLILTVLATLCATGCNDPSSNAGNGDPHDPTSCGPGVRAVPYEGATHVPEGTIVQYKANPPASGSHWPIWSPWGLITNAPVPVERWVHNLEHGGIVLLFNCPDVTTDAAMPPDAAPPDLDFALRPPCPDVANPLISLWAERAPDKYGAVRVLVTSAPTLPTRAAAVAWTWAWTGDTVDKDTVRCFIDKRYGQGPEDVP